jgi:hypothetical protein
MKKPLSSYDIHHYCPKWHVDRKKLGFLLLEGLALGIWALTLEILNLGLSKFGLVESGLLEGLPYATGPKVLIYDRTRFIQSLSTNTMFLL